MADTVVATIKAIFGMDYGQFTRGARAVSQQADGLAGKLGKVGTVLKTAFAGVAVKQVLDFGVAMFKVGMQSEAFGRKYRAVFGENTAALDTWVEAHHESFGVATDEVQGYLAQIGNLLTGMGNTADEAGAQATKILDLAGAWSAWSGGQISVQDASDKLVKGMMGQTRGLIELGLKVTEEEVNARMVAQGLDKLTGAEASRAQQQVMWTLIQEKSNTALGAYGTALDGSYGAAMSTATAVDELKDRIGELVIQLAPAIITLAEMLGLLTNLATLNFAGTNKWVAEHIMPAFTWGRGGYSGDWQTRIAEEQTRQQQAALRRRMMFYLAFRNQGDAIARQEAARRNARYLGARGGPAELMQMGGQMIDPSNIGRVAARMRYEMSAAMEEAAVNPVTEAFKEARRAVATGFTAIGNAFSTFELPEISVAEFMQNFSDWQTAQENVDAMMGELGDHGLAAFATSLAEGLSQDQLAWIAKVWGGNIASLYGLFPAYAPGGPQHPNTGGGYDYGPGSADSLSRNGASGGGGAPSVTLNVGGSILTEGGLVSLIEDAVIRIMGRGGRSSAFDHAGASSVHTMS